jgi:hypothetical protein
MAHRLFDFLHLTAAERRHRRSPSGGARRMHDWREPTADNRVADV